MATSSGDWPWRRRRLARQPAPLPRPDPVVGVARDERHRRGLDHAVVLADHAALAAFLMLDHNRPFQHGAHAHLLAVDHGIEAAADLVVGGRNDAGERNEIDDFAHVQASLGLGGGLYRRGKMKSAERSIGTSEAYQNVTRPPPAWPGARLTGSYAAGVCS